MSVKTHIEQQQCAYWYQVLREERGSGLVRIPALTHEVPVSYTTRARHDTTGTYAYWSSSSESHHWYWAMRAGGRPVSLMIRPLTVCTRATASTTP